MSHFEMEWHTAPRIVIARYHGDISIEMIGDINDRLEEFLDSGNAPIHFIVDASEMESFPTSMNKLRKNLSILHRDEWGWFITIGMNSMANFVITMIGSIFGLKIKAADSIEDAERILQRVDFSLTEVTE